MTFDLEKLGQGQMMTLMMKTGRNMVNNGPRDSVPQTFIVNDKFPIQWSHDI